MDKFRSCRRSGLLAQFHTRRTLLASLLSIVLPRRASAIAQTRATPQEDGGLVFDYYQAINARNFVTAYGYLGSKLTASQSRTDFRRGFSDTVFDDLVINAVHPDTTTGRVVYDVTITAWHIDGAVLVFTGSYTEGLEHGVSKLVDANILPAVAHGIPHLCQADDLTASMSGDAGAGQRYGTVTVTNATPTPCVLGGVPKVTIRDGHGRVLITAVQEPGTLITTVTLRTGQKAALEMHWSNWCGPAVDGAPRAIVRLLGNRGRLDELTGIGVPPCLSDPASKSTLTVKPWRKIFGTVS